MKKTKIKQRVENARDAFFADDLTIENYLESFRGEENLEQSRKFSDSAPARNSLETVLKQVFLFFPGTFILYILSMGLTVVFVGNFIRSSGMTLRVEMIWVLLIFLAATLMTWLGLGDVREPKHLVIPASIIVVGAVVGSIVAVLITIPFYGRLFFRDSFPIYVFPLALIVPFLAKGLVDRKRERL